MYLAYSLLLSLGLLLLSPYFLYQALAHRKYVSGFRERFGFLPTPDNPPDKPIVWLHCVSVGETQAARPLVERIRKDWPQHALVVSTVTLTGQTLARDLFRNHAARVFYFPFDWRWSVRRALDAINPAAVLVMETELWPNFLRECKSRDIPVALVNGRISRKSFARYLRIRFFLRKVLECLTIAVMQSERDAERLRELGMRKERLFSVGNLKFEAGGVADQKTDLKTRFGLQADRPLILAASTHAPEEKIVIDSFKRLRESRLKEPLASTVRLMIAPRHPERFNEVAELIQASGLTWTRRTNAPGPEDETATVILLDTIGELTSVYSHATVVFVGGSIVDRGGHNVLEPAAHGVAVITGKHTHNFHAIVELLNEAHAILQLGALEDTQAVIGLAEALRRMLVDVDWRNDMGRRAKEIVAANQGATEKTMKLIAPLFAAKAAKSSPSDSLLPASAT
ncbi:MAG TPA: 3-deoxy-D-manno-octulosonic acid transferase [Pyrinomonadaceae bacterium]|nr:3-deoxy-D-manno-octulosonic acid transferase [Pyrinomonadaceae bacterium]